MGVEKKGAEKKFLVVEDAGKVLMKLRLEFMA